MSAPIQQIHPLIEKLVQVSSGQRSNASLHAVSNRLVCDAGPDWQMLYHQLQSMQQSPFLMPNQKLHLASCERYFLTFFYGYKDYKSMYGSAIDLVSTHHLEASLNLLTSSAKCCASAGDFDQAVGFLNQCLSMAISCKKPVDTWPVFNAAVFIFNRMHRHQLAQTFAQHCVMLANYQGDKTEQQISQFILLNSKRLLGGYNLQSQYRTQLSLLNKGNMSYEGVNQFLLAVYAAHHALDQEQPDCKSANKYLAGALERIDEASDYSVSQYLLAQTKNQLAQGRTQHAKDAVTEALFVLHDTDLPLALAIKQHMRYLGLKVPECCITDQYTPVKPMIWQQFERLSKIVIHADTQKLQGVVKWT